MGSTVGLANVGIKLFQKTAIFTSARSTPQVAQSLCMAPGTIGHRREGGDTRPHRQVSLTWLAWVLAKSSPIQLT